MLLTGRARCIVSVAQVCNKHSNCVKAKCNCAALFMRDRKVTKDCFPDSFFQTYVLVTASSMAVGTRVPYVVQPIPLGVTFSNAVSKLKAQSSNVSLSFELWAFENVTVSGIGCTILDLAWSGLDLIFPRLLGSTYLGLGSTYLRSHDDFVEGPAQDRYYLDPVMSIKNEMWRIKVKSISRFECALDTPRVHSNWYVNQYKIFECLLTLD